MRRYDVIACVVALSLCFCTIGCREGAPEPTGKEVISTKGAPAAIGPYSQAIKAGNYLFCSGQIPLHPETGEIVSGTIEEQTRRVLENLGAVLAGAEMTFSDVVSATVFMDDLENYVRVNAVYAEYFKVDPPARCAVEVSRLPKDVAIEIALIAHKE